MRFSYSDYKNFEEFIMKENFTAVEGIKILEEELDQLKKKEGNNAK